MLHGFVLGILLTALITAIPTVMATPTKRTIDVVYNDIKLVIDGREVTPLDANGNVVEPFAYNGTTYLPLRAVSNALTDGTKPVSWDQDTFTVYIGDRPIEGNKIVDMATMKTYPGAASIFKTGKSFEVRQKTYSPFNALGTIDGGSFLLNGDYTELKGFVAVPDGKSFSSSYCKFTNPDTGEELLKVDVKSAEDPVEVSLNVTGLDKLKIWTNGSYFFNATLTTINKD